MAKALDPNDSAVDFRRSRGESWFQAEWLDGQPWLLEAGTDFPNTAENHAENARTRLYSEASRLDKAGRAKVLGNGDIIFQAYDMTAEDKQKRIDATAKRMATRQANIEAMKARGEEPPKRRKKGEAVV